MVNLSIFAERLKEYVVEENLTETMFARKINVSRVTVCNLLNAAHVPSTETFVKIIEYFNCSADYLLGLTDIPNGAKFTQNKKFGEILRKLLKENNKTEYRFQKDLNLSGSLTYRWLNNKATPSIESFIVLSKYFGCTADYLLGRES